MFLRLLTLFLFIGIFLHLSLSSLATPIDENDYLPQQQQPQPSSTTLSIVKNPLFSINNTTDDDARFTDTTDDQEESLIASLLMIGISEIGDKTFLIAAVMAMKHSRWAVFTGAFSALSIMAIVSTLLGRVVPSLIPKSYTDMIAAILFFIFGLRMAWEVYHMKHQRQQKQEPNNNNNNITHDNNETKIEEYNLISQEEVQGGGEGEEEIRQQRKQQPVLIEAFILTFLGEWGDKSQISTIALAASNVMYFI